jgi:hypothetical protein
MLRRKKVLGGTRGVLHQISPGIHSYAHHKREVGIFKRVDTARVLDHETPIRQYERLQATFVSNNCTKIRANR